jgi:hypothetical protein
MRKVTRPVRGSRKAPPPPPIACAECECDLEFYGFGCNCFDPWPLFSKVLPLVERLVAGDETRALRGAFAEWLRVAKQQETEEAAARHAPRRLRRVVLWMIGNGGEHMPSTEHARIARGAGVPVSAVVAAKRWIADGGLAQQGVTRGS